MPTAATEAVRIVRPTERDTGVADVDDEFMGADDEAGSPEWPEEVEEEDRGGSS